MRILKPVLLCTAALAGWSVFAVIAAFYGWWMNPVASSGDRAGFYEWAVSEIDSTHRGTSALVMIEDGQVARTHFTGDVNEDTLFPTASFSKWITALAVMSLVETRQLDLDAPVSRYLKRWQLPDSPFDNEAVTARRLLSHTAGLTDGLGFGDYKPDEKLPTLEESLRSPRASDGTATKIAVGQEPGGEFLYSGGGYLVLQLLVEEISDQRFADFVQGGVLDPVGMSRSTYAYLGEIENASSSYDVDGSIAPTYQYASAAATAFSSSARDLSQLVLAVLAADQAPLKPETIISMREPHGFVMGTGIWGLGTMLYVQAPGGDFVFGHDGANDPAINSALRINPETANGLVMLVSGHPSLASDIGSQWVLWQTGYPDFLSSADALRSALQPILIGGIVIIGAGFLWARRRLAAKRS